MDRAFERAFKRSVASILRLLFRSRPPELPQNFSPRGILVIRQHNQLGDMLCVVPLLRALRKRYPSARLDLMASPVNQEVMLQNKYLDGVVLYDKREFLRNGRIYPLALLRFIKRLRAPYEMVLVPGTVSTSFTSDFLAFLTGSRVRIGVGSLEGRPNPSSFFFNVAEDLDWSNEPHRHQTLRNLDIARSLGLDTPDLSHEMTLLPDEILSGEELARTMRGQKPLLIGFHPGAGKPPNRWPAERFAELMDRLRERTGAEVFVTSGPMDDEVIAATLKSMKCPAQLLANQPIRAVASVLRKADLYVTNDTGVMHIAAAVGAPVVALFGPTDPEQWAPRGAKIRYIRGEKTEIEGIQINSVLQACLEALQRN